MPDSVILPARFAAKAPFPWFGGKSQAAPLVWQLLGDVDHYCEPFAGSLAVLLARPHPCNRAYYSETVNDCDGLLVNAWRAIAFAPDATAEAASWPVTEADKIARQIALLRWRQREELEHLMGDPQFHDPVMAGWWLYGVACQIGAFAGDGPWTADPLTGRLIKQTGSAGTRRDRQHLSNNGQGVNHAELREPGVAREAQQFHPLTMPKLRAWMALLAARLRHVRILNGDWSRLCTKGASHTLTVRQSGHAGLFLDPPYAGDSRANGLYAHDSASVADTVCAWALRAGSDPHNRIVLAGYDTEHTELEAAGWSVHEWFAHNSLLRGGMGEQQHRERLWSSPHCLALDCGHQGDLFAPVPVE